MTEALILAGGKAERLGDAAKGKPKPLVEVCGRPLMAYQIDRLRQAGVERVIVSCAVGKGKLFEEELAGLGTEIVPVEEPEPLGRGGGLRLAASARATRGPVFALNGDELIDLDLSTLLAHHRARGAAATITVVPLVSAFGIVDVSEEDMVGGSGRRHACPLGERRGVRPRRRVARRVPGAGRPREVHVPGARRGRTPRRVPPPRASGSP